jgi:hypothetical protein
MKCHFDEKTIWVDVYLNDLQKLNCDISTIAEILSLIKRKYPHLPPTTDTIRSSPNSIATMKSYIPTPESTHKEALQCISDKHLPQHQMLRWAGYWSENSDAFFIFEIIVVAPNRITGNPFFLILLKKQDIMPADGIDPQDSLPYGKLPICMTWNHSWQPANKIFVSTLDITVICPLP